MGTWAHDSCENVKVWLLQQERRGQRAGTAGQSFACAVWCSARVGRGYRGMQEHCMGAGMCTGHPTCPGCHGSPSAFGPAVAMRGREGEPCCRSESRKAKAHRFPQPVTAKHELPNPQARVSSVSSPSLPGHAWQGRGRALAGSAIHTCGAQPGTQRGAEVERDSRLKYEGVIAAA